MITASIVRPVGKHAGRFAANPVYLIALPVLLIAFGMLASMALCDDRAKDEYPNESEFPILEGRLAVGDVGLSPSDWLVMQRISDTEALIEGHIYGVNFDSSGRVVSSVEVVKERYIVYASGFDFKGKVDGEHFDTASYGGKYSGNNLVKITGTKTYRTAMGSMSTVPLVEPVDMKALKEEAEKKLWRVWTDSTGTHKVEAKLKEFRDGKAWLVKRDESVVGLSLSQLSKEDQEYVRDELKRRQDANSRSAR